MSSIKGRKEEIQKEWEAGASPDSKYVKRRKTVYEDLNQKVYEWFVRARAKHMRLTGGLIQVSIAFIIDF